MFSWFFSLHFPPLTLCCCCFYFHSIFPEHSKNRLRNPLFGSSFNAGQDGFKIVVEESNNCDENDIATSSTNQSTPRDSLDIGSPCNPYLLSPWRETRKHSLPSQQVTEGITASQVRRLSERGGEGSGPSPKVCISETLFVFLCFLFLRSIAKLVFFSFICSFFYPLKSLQASFIIVIKLFRFRFNFLLIFNGLGNNCVRTGSGIFSHALTSTATIWT